jgi:hypothetical protein
MSHHTKQTMKKLLSAILALISLQLAYAQELIACPDGTMADPSVGCVNAPSSLVDSNTSAVELINRFSVPILTMVIAASTVMLMAGGIRYAMAAGDEEHIQKAKRTMVWSSVGLGVGLLARLLVAGVVGLL